MTVDPDRVVAVFGRLFEASHELPPDQLGALVEQEILRAGFVEANVYLVDHEQRHLVPLTASGATGLAVDGSLGGKAFQTEEPVEGDAGENRRLWLVLRDGVERLGVLALVAPVFTEALVQTCQHLSTLVAELVVSKLQYGDALVNVRRSRPMTLAAELRWSVLPPRTVSSPRAALAAALEPAYEVAGDAFDYSLSLERVEVAIFDAMGHGLEAARMANLAMGSYRHSRRAGAGLEASYRALDEVIEGEFGEDRFVTGQIGVLDTAIGRFSWVNAGHPGPLLVRGAKLVGGPEGRVSLPFGLGDKAPEVNTVALEPEDRLVFYTDGLVEATSPSGEPFGEERLADAVISAYSEQHAVSEAARRLMNAVVQHRGVTVTDDATVMILAWRGQLL